MPTLNWIGKDAVVNHHKEVPFRLLKPVDKLSVLPHPSLPSPAGRGDEGAGNLLIQGDNLEALKALLPYYAGQVKCIYIDPPYNTGNEGWVYNDNVNSPEMKSWLGKVVGGEAEDLSRHDKWLCMMYPRLALLKQFLREDGIIFISVDEFEHRHLEVLMDEIFGHENHIETIIWKKSYGGGAKSNYIVNLHEYIVCFANDIEKIGNFELPPSETVLKYYKYKDDKFEKRGPYRLQPLATTSMDERPNLRYAINYEGHKIMPEKQWQWSKDRVENALQNDELVFSHKANKWSVSYKQYLRDQEGTERSQKPYSIIEGIYTQQGTQEIQRILGDGKAFSFPKPSNLIKLLIQFSTNPNDLVLDSFAGSGTTGHAILKQNAEDNGNRRFILVEMDNNIAQNITVERVKRVALGYTYKDQKGTKKKEAGLGGGFRYCELGATLFDADGQIREEVKYNDLAQHVYFIETGRPIPPPFPNGKGAKAAKGRSRFPLLGIHNDTAVYLLYNGVLKDKKPNGGNVLTRNILKSLPKHEGAKIFYGTGCLLSEEKLRELGITFRQIPYEVKAS